ncbi:MAG: SDR family oxidoreductase [Xanthobacteraceae bacterium]|nr:SDR family oxidoreductase [Xanthobacteraceae bacterium]
MATPAKLLLTGASGFLGATLLPRLAADFAVAPLSRRGGAGFVAADLTEAAAVTRALREARPEIVVHAAAWTSVDGCERDQPQAYAQNVMATLNLVEACAALTPAPMIVYVSTDQFYDGAGPHAEDGPVTPRNVYALTKLWAEGIVLRAAGALVLRSNFFGIGRKPGEGLAGWLLESLAAGKPVTVFDDVLFNPLYLEDYADLLIELIRARAHGVVNLGADGEGPSKAAFAYALAERFGISAASASRGSVENLKLAAVRPKDMRMDVARLRALLPGRTIPTVASGIDRMKRDADRAGGSGRKENRA